MTVSVEKPDASHSPGASMTGEPGSVKLGLAYARSPAYWREARFQGEMADAFRFYAGRLSSADKLRLLVGRPPVPVRGALKALFEGDALHAG